MKSNLKLFVLIPLLLAFLLPGSTVLGRGPVVRAVLFFSPTCGHCHKVIEQDLPPIMEKYGEQLQIVGINVADPQGQQLYQSMIQQFNVPDERLGVPALVIGEVLLVGALEIPEQFPGLIEEGLNTGGVDWPVIPGLSEILASIEGANEPVAGDEPAFDASQSFSLASMGENFARDRVGNTLAVVTLALMVFSLGAVGYLLLSDRPLNSNWVPMWVLPALSVVGLGVAGYLSYIEITHSQAICGPVGDCNSVQQSPYAYIMGVIPVGVFGAVGYLAILGGWLVQHFGPVSIRKWAAIAVWGMAIFGLLFSIYLTFLEPFVIGATCAWCIASAIVMTLVVWVVTPPAKAAWHIDLDADLDLEEDKDDGEETFSESDLRKSLPET